MGLLKQRRKSNQMLTGAIDEITTQIESISIVYGLQARKPYAQIQFKQLLDAIIRSASCLSQISLSLASGPVAASCELDREKAVAVALVVNELITNASKHFQSQNSDDEIKIMQKYHPEYIRLTIKNPGRLPKGFDLQTKTQLGTGLELATAMLPSSGARRTISQQRFEVVAELKLSQPLLIGAA